VIDKLEQAIIELWRNQDLLGGESHSEGSKFILLPKAKHELIKVWNEGLPKKYELNELGSWQRGNIIATERLAKITNQAIDEMKITDHRILNGICVKCGYEE